MDAFASLGPEQSGSRLAEQDSITNFIKLSQGQALQAQAQQEQFKTEQARKLMQAMSQLKTPDGKGGPGAGGSLADLPAYQGEQLVKLGFPEAGAKLLHDASRIRSEEALAGERKAHADERALNMRSTMLEYAGRLAGTVKSGQDWAAAGMAFAQAFPGAPNPFRGSGSPQQLQQIRTFAITEKDRIEAERRAAEDQKEDSLRRARISEISQTTKLRKAQTEQEEERTAILRKEGGSRGPTAVGSPTREERSAAVRLLESELPGLAEESRSVVADIVASRAEALVTAHKGLDIDTARRRVLGELLEDGTLRKEVGLLERAGVAERFRGDPTYTYVRDAAGRFAPTPAAPPAAPGPAEGRGSMASPIPLNRMDRHAPGHWYIHEGKLYQYRDDGKFYPLKENGNGRRAFAE